MKREIKVKGQPIGKMGLWVYGIGAYKTNTAEHLIINAKGESIEVVNLCWWTGLKDKNGKEIYEGDIVMCVVFGYERHEFPVEIVYLNGRFVGHNSDELTEDIDIDDLVLIEVIGNMHDNPELLKGGGE